MNNIKKGLPYLFALLFFVVLAYTFSPEVLKGKIVNQSDIASWHGMSHEITSYNKAHPKEDPTLWTNSMFSGMPAYTISAIYKGDITKYLYNLLFWGNRPPSYLIISLIGGFLLLLAFGVNPWLSIVGAVGITFCSYNFQILQVGHNTKMVAIAFMPWVLAAVAYSYRKRPLLGAGLFALALSFQVKANHPQITYYLGMITLFFVVAECVTAIKEKKVKRFILVSSLVLSGGLLGIATNINHLWPLQEYAKYSMRGGSELSGDEGNAGKKGLKLDYATMWCYSPGETFNLLIPNFKGGVSGGNEFGENSETVEWFRAQGYSGAEQVARSIPAYWGQQPSTAGPMYMGAVIFFLFLLGLFLTRGTLRWWMMGLGVVTLLLSWGGNAMWFTRFFSEYIPLYNKFRTVSMILVIFQILFPLLGMVAVQQLLFPAKRNGVDVQVSDKRSAVHSKSSDKESSVHPRAHIYKSLYWAGGIVAGFCLLMMIIPSLAGSFLSGHEQSYGIPKEMLPALQADRLHLLTSDAFRSLCFVILTIVVLWLGVEKKIKREWVMVGLGLLILLDMWPMGKRYLNNDHFVRQQAFHQQFEKRPVDQEILQDPTPYYRVLDLTASPFADAHLSYWHKSIVGYSPAKLQRYQEMIDRYIHPQIGAMSKMISSCSSFAEAEEGIGAYPVLNMLNTKYVVIQPNGNPLINEGAFGNVWFCSQAVWASTPDEELSLIEKVDVSKTAVLHKSFQRLLLGFDGAVADTNAFIRLTKYAPNSLEYEYSSKTPQLALFSDVWYPAGWKATINNNPVEIARANYILRALYLPEGTFTIRFDFAPESYSKGATYSRISSVLLLLMLMAGIFSLFDKSLLSKVNPLIGNGKTLESKEKPHLTKK